jgi:ribosomal protein L25 (general stress protein Ctc)
MKHFTLKGEIRQKGNKAVMKAFRAQGLVPCNLYGAGMENILFTVNEKELKGLTHTPASYIVDLNLDGKVYTAICKYLPIKSGVSTVENRRSDPAVLRVSEMYLIHAEALCLGGGDLKGAAEDIKALRARALGKNPSEISLSYTGADGLDRLIQEERAKELCFEGHRYFDLKRRHEDIVRPATTTSTVRTLKYPDYRYVLPICQLEMQANDSMIQNENYD